MNEPRLHAASVGITHTAAGHAALIGRASRRVYGSFAKRSAYTRLRSPNQDPRRSALFSYGISRCVPPRREQKWLRLANSISDEAMFICPNLQHNITIMTIRLLLLLVVWIIINTNIQNNGKCYKDKKITIKI